MRLSNENVNHTLMKLREAEFLGRVVDHHPLLQQLANWISSGVHFIEVLKTG